MGLGKIVLVILVLLGLVWYFAPDKFEDGKSTMMSFVESKTKDKAVDMLTDDVSSKIDTTFDYNITDIGANFGKIIGKYNCIYDLDCTEYFNIEGLTCMDNGECVLVMQNATIE